MFIVELREQRDGQWNSWSADDVNNVAFEEYGAALAWCDGYETGVLAACGLTMGREYELRVRDTNQPPTWHHCDFSVTNL